MRGLEGTAELVVELVSPGDESRVKLPWYLARAVREVILIDRDTLAVEVHRNGAGGAPVLDGGGRSEVFGCACTRVDDDLLQIVTPGGTFDVIP